MIVLYDCIILYTFRCVPDVASKHTDAFSDDPCSAQGERISSGCFEIDPNYVYKDDTSSQTSEYSSSETDSDRNDESVHLQPTPSSQLLVRRTGRRRNTAVYYDNSQTDENSESELTESSPANSPVPARRFSTISEPPLSHRRKRGRVGRPVSRGSVSSMSSKAQVSVTASREAPNNYRDTSVGDMDKFNKAPEPRRHVSTLFLPSSPLLNENLKVCTIYTACVLIVHVFQHRFHSNCSLRFGFSANLLSLGYIKTMSVLVHVHVYIIRFLVIIVL